MDRFEDDRKARGRRGLLRGVRGEKEKRGLNRQGEDPWGSDLGLG